MLGEQRTSNCNFLYPEFNAEGKVPSHVSLASGRRISVSVSSSSLPTPCLTPFTPESGLLWLFGLPPLWKHTFSPCPVTCTVCHQNRNFTEQHSLYANALSYFLVDLVLKMLVATGNWSDDPQAGFHLQLDGHCWALRGRGAAAGRL